MLLLTIGTQDAILVGSFILLALHALRPPAKIIINDRDRNDYSGGTILLFIIIVAIGIALMTKGGCNFKFPSFQESPDNSVGDTLRPPIESGKKYKTPVHIVNSAATKSEWGRWAVLLGKFRSHEIAERLVMDFKGIHILEMSDRSFWAIIKVSSEAAGSDKIDEWYDFEDKWSHLDLEMKVIDLQKYRK